MPLSVVSILTAGALLGPAGVLRPQSIRPVVTHGPPGPRLEMCASADERSGRRFAAVLRPLRKASVSVATAVLLTVAGPRGSARAAEQLDLQPPRATTSRPVASEPPLALISPTKARSRKKSKAPARPTKPNEISFDAALPRRMARQFTSEKFIFSDSLTSRSPLQEELEELDMLQDERSSEGQLRGVVTFGGSVGLLYGIGKGLQSVERYFRNQEKRDIAEEMELTGQYISFDAGDVEGAVDPKTGKNITVAKGEASALGGEAAKVSRDAEGEIQEKQLPWLLRVLGATNADDDFWEPASKATPSTPKPSDGTGGADDGSADGGGGVDGVDDTDGGGEGDDGDSEGLDTLDDLLG